MARLIDADVFKKNMDYVCTMGGWLEPISSAITEYVKKHIDAQTTVDAVKVVRCYECKHRAYCYSEVAMTNKSQTADIYKSVNFCSYGEKETDHE